MSSRAPSRLFAWCCLLGVCDALLQLLARQPRALHDSARHAQARAHVQPHRPEARSAAPQHRNIARARADKAFSSSIPPPALVFKSCLCCIIAQPCGLQVFCVARASAWTVAAAAGAGEACAVAEHVFAVNCCCDASMWSGEVCVGLLHGNSTASD